MPARGYDKAKPPAEVHAAMSALGFDRHAVRGHGIGALACTHRSAVALLAMLDAAMPGWSEGEANAATSAPRHLAFHQRRALPERLLFGREHDHVSTFISDRAFPVDHRNALTWKLAIRVPALGGEHDYGSRMVAMLEEFASDVSGGSIAGRAHWLPEERPAETTDALIRFLTGAGRQ